jgi:ATP-dependent DNA ligase
MRLRIVQGGQSSKALNCSDAEETGFAQSSRWLHRHHGLPPRLQVAGGPEWIYEIKLDGYRLEAVRSAGRITLYSRRQKC